MTISIPGATRGIDLNTGATTCEGSAQKAGTSCFALWPQNSQLRIRAAVDAPLPAGWTLSLVYDNNTGEKVVPCENQDSMSCSATVLTPLISQTEAVGVMAKVFTAPQPVAPRAAAALGVNLTH